jgi:hypothetical protein
MATSACASAPTNTTQFWPVGNGGCRPRSIGCWLAARGCGPRLSKRGPDVTQFKSKALLLAKLTGLTVLEWIGLALAMVAVPGVLLADWAEETRDQLQRADSDETDQAGA